VDHHPVADGGCIQPRHLGQAAPRFRDPPDPPRRSTAGDLRQEAIEKSSHGILPLFALNRF
jgi:hypothetical protein